MRLEESQRSGLLDVISSEADRLARIVNDILWASRLDSGQMGVAITPLLTALGVSSLAVALALQPTLTNLFAGISILLSNRIRVGDYVELDSGQAGVVTDVGWRSTLVEELAGNTFIIPNSKFAEMVLKNYNLPVSQNALAVEVKLATTVDLDRAENVAREVAKDVQRTVPGAIHDFEPGVVFKALGDTGVVLAIALAAL